MVQFLRIYLIFELNQILKTYSVWVEVDSKNRMLDITEVNIDKQYIGKVLADMHAINSESSTKHP